MVTAIPLMCFNSAARILPLSTLGFLQYIAPSGHFLLPAYFLSDHVLPFSVSGWRLGFVEVARIVFPQAFGFAALILAFLTHQYGQMLKERGCMQQELDLTI